MAVRLRDNAFQLIIGYVAVQPAIFVGIAECDVDMRELVEVELAERLIIPVGQIAFTLTMLSAFSLHELTAISTSAIIPHSTFEDTLIINAFLMYNSYLYTKCSIRAELFQVLLL